jgi:hypothetical protein
MTTCDILLIRGMTRDFFSNSYTLSWFGTYLELIPGHLFALLKLKETKVMKQKRILVLNSGHVCYELQLSTP